MAFCLRAVKEAGVAAIPVSAFYETAPVTSDLRLCFAKRDETLDEGVERLAKARDLSRAGSQLVPLPNAGRGVKRRWLEIGRASPAIPLCRVASPQGGRGFSRARSSRRRRPPWSGRSSRRRPWRPG
jgi:hypothetical protein